MSHESPSLQQQQAQELWNAALQVIHDTPADKTPRLLDHSITTIPPESRAPEQITLRHWSDGSWNDKYRTLAITALGPVSYEYSVVSWNPPTPEADTTDTYGPEEPETLDYLAELVQQLHT